MPQFRAQQHVVEHPALLCDLLLTRGLLVRVVDGTWATGREENLDVHFEFRPKRFQANLHLFVYSPKVSQETENYLNEVIAGLNASSELSDKISSLLADLGISRVDHSLDDEINFALSKCAGSLTINKIVCAVREQQELVRRFATEGNLN